MANPSALHVKRQAQGDDEKMPAPDLEESKAGPAD
jgi:hypothetical protein